MIKMTSRLFSYKSMNQYKIFCAACAIFIIPVLARTFWLLNFPAGQAPAIQNYPSKPKSWPSEGVVPACMMQEGDKEMFKSHSHFSVASLLSGVNEIYALYALRLGVSIRKFVDVDMLLLIPVQQNGSVNAKDFRQTLENPIYRDLKMVGWRTCFVPALSRSGLDGDDYHSAYVYTKLAAWNLSYEAVLLIDLDTLIVGDNSPLFEDLSHSLRQRGSAFAAAMDHPQSWSPRWTPAGDRFNSGVILLLPSPNLFKWLVQGIDYIQHPEGLAEQSYLNVAMRQKHIELPLEYNAMTVIAYSEPWVWTNILPNIRILHFTFPKPHMAQRCEDYNVREICEFWNNSPTVLE